MKDNLYYYKFTLERVIDGDSIVGSIDLGFDIILRDQHIRLKDIDTPELRGPYKDLALSSKLFVIHTLQELSPLIIINTSSKDSFGRWLATVFYNYPPSSQWLSLNYQLLYKGLAKPY